MMLFGFFFFFVSLLFCLFFPEKKQQLNKPLVLCVLIIYLKYDIPT
jgi:FtsH-binding integral membrane protein